MTASGQGEALSKKEGLMDIDNSVVIPGGRQVKKNL